MFTNTFPPTYPDGYDVEIFSEKVLEKAYLNAKTDYEKSMFFILKIIN